jgi:UDPglucose 6-dehydrogenase
VSLYQGVASAGTPVIVTGIESAELAKYASNAYLATKLSFVNEIADLCEVSGARVEDVTAIMGLDPRIGSSYLGAGPGFGGSCLPKDVQGLLHTSNRFGAGSTIAAAALSVNESRKNRMADKVEEALGSPVGGATVAVLGLTFKAGTDDLRHSPAIDLIGSLVARGAAVRAHDPKGMPAAKAILPPEVELCPDPSVALEGADAMVIATEWPEYAALDLAEVAALLARPVVVDLRNLLDPVAVTGAGLSYASIGRAPAT